MVSKNERKVTVLVRYLIKSTKSVVSYVENDKGTRYYVTLNRNGKHSCSCPAKKGTCYHVSCVRELENTRIEARKAARTVSTVSQEVVNATPVAVQEYRMSDEVYANLKGIETTAQEVVERKQAWDRMRCCLIFVDTREPVDPEAYAEMLRPQREAAEERMLKAALTQNRAFSLMR